MVLDDDRKPVPVGRSGSCVGGPSGSQLPREPGITVDRFVPDLRAIAGEYSHRTGDLGRFTPDGRGEYLSRTGSQVEVRGHCVDLQEIESILLGTCR
jgi:non-ribosomal peptide synthetase component F